MRFNLGIVDIEVHFHGYPYVRRHTDSIEQYIWLVVRFDNGGGVVVSQARPR